MKINVEKVSEIIKSAIQEKGTTQKNVATSIGMNEQGFGGSNGTLKNHSWKLDTFFRVCDVLQIDPFMILNNATTYTNNINESSIMTTSNTVTENNGMYITAKKIRGNVYSEDATLGNELNLIKQRNIALETENKLLRENIDSLQKLLKIYESKN